MFRFDLPFRLRIVCICGMQIETARLTFSRNLKKCPVCQTDYPEDFCRDLLKNLNVLHGVAKTHAASELYLLDIDSSSKWIPLRMIYRLKVHCQKCDSFLTLPENALFVLVGREELYCPVCSEIFKGMKDFLLAFCALVKNADNC